MRAWPVIVVVMLLAGCSVAGQRPSPPAERDELAGRAAHTMTAVRAGLLVAGGCVVDGCATATATSFIIDGLTERRVGALHQARDAHTATRLRDGRVLVTGGFAAEGEPPLATSELYDPESERWVEVGDLRVGRGGHAAALLGDGRVLVAGGWTGPGTYTATTEIFDPGAGTFSPGPDLPAAVDGLAAVTLADGCALVGGGQQSPGHASGAVATICPDGTVRRTSLLEPRFKHAFVALPSGLVLAIGGTPDDVGLLSSTEVLDPAIGRFRPGPRLLAGRYKLAGSAAVLPDGRVLVAGGGPGIEVLDPVTASSRRLEAAGASRRSFATVGVTDARVIVLGGYDERIRLTRTYLSLPLDMV